MEEAELTEVLRSTISNPQSKAYKRMLSAMFSQPVSAAADYTYDIDYCKVWRHFLSSGQVWGHTPEQRVAASTLRRYSFFLRLAIAQADARPVMPISFR